MNPALAALPDPEPVGSLTDRLLAEVRPEFQVEVYRPDSADPVLGGECAVVACDGLRGSSMDMCHAHYARWHRVGRPEISAYLSSAEPRRRQGPSRLSDCFQLTGLTLQLRLEFAYALQCRHDDRAGRLTREVFKQTVRAVSANDVDSLLELALDDWLKRLPEHSPSNARGYSAFLRYSYRKVEELLGDPDPDVIFASDVWDARRLKIPTVGGVEARLRFGQVAPGWLKEASKRWARFRLSTGKAFGTVGADLRALIWFATFLNSASSELRGPYELTRPLLEDYLSWLATCDLHTHTRLGYLVGLRTFLDHCRRHGWLPGLPATATIYPEDLPRRNEPLPRFVSEFVMQQMESPDNLARLLDPTVRHLLIVLIETGLRISDACLLPLHPTVDDSAGWPCLRFLNTKVAAEQLIPLSAEAADAIRAQQDHVQDRWPERSSWLFPRNEANSDGTRSFSPTTARRRLAAWQTDIDLRDEAGQSVRATPHQFRHTLGTRMINDGIPQHVIQKLLGHKSSMMAARYATLHDSTVRAAFDDYQRNRVDVRGRGLPFDPKAPSADAEWIKHNLARVAASLPNGYCGRPPQQDCPHPNACLTCPDFQTTPQFLPLHRRQRDDTLVLLTAAEQGGNTRLVANHRQVVDNLERVIDTLETLSAQEPSDAS